MFLGFSTNAYSKKTLSYAIDSISGIGYDGVEIVLDVPHVFLPISNSQIVEIKTLLRTKKLKVSNLNANTVLGWYSNKKNSEKFEPSLSNINKKLRMWRISYSKKAIDLAVELDCPSISITSGILTQNDKPVRLVYFKKSLQELSIYAEKKSIQLAIEYEPGLLLGNSEDVWKFVSKFKNVGLNLDTCHAGSLGENITSIIKKFGKKIFHTHISDCKNKQHYHLIPGLGEINFKKMYKALLAENYSLFLTAELYTYNKNPEKAALDTFIYLRNLMN